MLLILHTFFSAYLLWHSGITYNLDWTTLHYIESVIQILTKISVINILTKIRLVSCIAPTFSKNIIVHHLLLRAKAAYMKTIRHTQLITTKFLDGSHALAACVLGLPKPEPFNLTL